jgi:hypothetical protein
VFEGKARSLLGPFARYKENVVISLNLLLKPIAAT